MEHPCPDDWQYEKHPKRKKLASRVADVLVRLRSKKIDGARVAQDSRPIHAELFKDLTPPHFAHFAGHYRGEPYRCLQTYRCGVPGDRRVGADPDDVAHRAKQLADLITQALAAADAMVASGSISDHDKTLHVVGVACQVFDLFLQIHPYANGNGHAARFIMWAIMGRYGFWPSSWPVEPRPPDPPYTPLLLRHRQGDTKPLVEYVLTCIA